jgi:glycosyltransferase involved in cell wall biosynthesis
MARSASSEEVAGETTPQDAGRKGGPAVLQLVPALDQGGVERGTIDIAEAIVAAGGRALVASRGGRMETALARVGGELIRMEIGRKSPAAIWRNAARLAELVRAEEVEILHARSRAPAWAGWLAARRTGVAFVTTYHGVYRENAPFKRLYNSVMAKGRPTIAVSEHVAALIRERYPRADVVVIPRGVNVAQFDPEAVSAERKAALMRRWALDDDPRPVVMLPGRLTRWKGQEPFIDAAALLRDRRGEEAARFLMVGDDPDGPFGRELRARIAGAGLEAVTLCGHCDDMAAALSLASVVASASTEPEAFGRVAAEGQAMRRPVVATDHGGARETVEDGVTGFRCAPGDAAALADAIGRALSLAPDEATRMGEAGRERVARMFSLESMRGATLEVYARVRGADGA